MRHMRVKTVNAELKDKRTAVECEPGQLVGSGSKVRLRDVVDGHANVRVGANRNQIPDAGGCT